MNKHLIAVLLAISSLQLSADFLLQNNTDMDLRLTLVAGTIYHSSPYGMDQGIYPKGTSKVEISPAVIFSPQSEFRIQEEGELRTRDTVRAFQTFINNKTAGYWNLLQQAKHYLPTFTVSRGKDEKDKQSKLIFRRLIIKGPADQKELKEAIEKAKKEAEKAVTKEICKATQLPHETGALAGIAAQYALEPDEEPKKE